MLSFLVLLIMISLPFGVGFGLAVFLKREHEAGRGVLPILEEPEDEGVLGIMKTSSAMQNVAPAKPPESSSATEISPENRPVQEQDASPADFEVSGPPPSNRGGDRQEPTSPMSEEIDGETEDESPPDEEEDVLARNRDFLENASRTSNENEEEESVSFSDADDLDAITRLLSTNTEAQEGEDAESISADLPQNEPETFDDADSENTFSPALEEPETEATTAEPEQPSEPQEIATTAEQDDPTEPETEATTDEPNLPSEAEETEGAAFAEAEAIPNATEKSPEPPSAASEAETASTVDSAVDSTAHPTVDSPPEAIPSEPISVFKVVPQELLEIQVCSNQEYFPEPSLQESVGSEAIVPEIPRELYFSDTIDYPTEMRALTRTEDAAIVLRTRKTTKKASPDR